MTILKVPDMEDLDVTILVIRNTTILCLTFNYCIFASEVNDFCPIGKYTQTNHCKIEEFLEDIIINPTTKKSSKKIKNDVSTRDIKDSLVHRFMDEILRNYNEKDNYCEIEEEHTHEESEEPLIEESSKRIKNIKNIYHYSGRHKYIFKSGDYEKIVTIHDSIGNLLFFKHYTWKDKILVQTIDDGIVRNIIKGETPCDFIIIEPSNDSVSYHLDPKKELDGFIRYEERFLAFITGQYIFSKQVSKLSALDAIMYKWHSYCKEYHEKNKVAEPLEDSISFPSDTEKKTDISAKNDGNFLSRILLYKIIIIGIVVICVIIIRKKWKRRG